MYIHHNIVLA